MKKLVGIFLLVAIATSCAKPHYLTREGKRKIKYYNEVYYGQSKPAHKR